MTRMFIYGPVGVSNQNSLIFLLEKFDQLDVAHLRQFPTVSLGDAFRTVELGLAASDEIQVIAVPVPGEANNRYFGELFKEMAVVFGSGEIFAPHQVKFQVFFEEEGDGEEVEVGGRQEARNHHNADLGHIDGQLQDEVRQGHRRVLEDQAGVVGQEGQRIANDGILLAELQEVLLFFEEDIPAVFEEAGGEFGVVGDEFIGDAELADDLVDEVVEGEGGLRMVGQCLLLHVVADEGGRGQFLPDGGVRLEKLTLPVHQLYQLGHPLTHSTQQSHTYLQITTPREADIRRIEGILNFQIKDLGKFSLVDKLNQFLYQNINRAIIMLLHQTII